MGAYWAQHDDVSSSIDVYLNLRTDGITLCYACLFYVI